MINHIYIPKQMKTTCPKLKNLFILSLMGLMVACSPSTKLTNSWMDPALTPETVKPFKKTLVVARIKDEASNRITEDKIVAKINIPSLPSYAFLIPGDTNTQKIDKRLKEQGFDGMIVMRLTDVAKKTEYTPGTTYYGGRYGGYYGGYYGYGYSTPGYLSEDHTYYVETSIFSLESGKLIWTGSTATVNPSQLDAALDEIIYAVRNDLIKKGLIKQK
jgi:hypothetical protein